MRIGAVNYLNSKPLVAGLGDAEPNVRLSFDLPSRLADSLADGRLDVALIPSVEFLRTPGYSIVSDACVACRGPVLSVKLHFRVPPAEVRRIALDEGSRTSAALSLVLLEELAGAVPQCEPLPIGAGLESSGADAVLLIGDRAIQQTEEPTEEVWDLGQKWCDWTGLPFVFAMWVARPGIDTTEISHVLSAARDRGIRCIVDIAKSESRVLGIDSELAEHYLRENLHFTLGEDEVRGFSRFTRLCVKRGLAPPDVIHTLEAAFTNDCPT